MPSTTPIRCQGLAFTYPGAPSPVFHGLDAVFTPGWTAVLGDNGIGKSTLMRMLTGELTPQSGAITPSPTGLVTAYCPQRIDERPATLDDFAQDWSPETMGIRRALGIGDDWPYRYGTLSGGEAKRVQIACALARRPDVLILDEPTNHVDEPTAMAISTAMNAFRGVGVLVSHDPELIDALCQRCVWFLRRHTGGGNETVVRTFDGGYTQAREQLAHDDRRDEQMRDRAVGEANRLHDVLRRRSADVQRAEAIKRHGSAIDRRDHDLRERRNTAKALSTDGVASRALAQVQRRAARAGELAASAGTAAKRYAGGIWFEARPSTRRELMRIGPGLVDFATGALIGDGDGKTTHADDRPLPSVWSTLVVDGKQTPGDIGPSVSVGDEGGAPTALRIPLLSVGPRDRIGVSGPNGLGKTTLLRALLRNGNAVPTLAIAQTMPDGTAERAMGELGGLRPPLRAQVLASYAQLNADTDRLLEGANPSPGELRKLMLCLGIAHHPELVVMDEPTNHLDLSSQQALAQALRDFPGAVILVSHSGWFLDRTTTVRWSVG